MLYFREGLEDPLDDLGMVQQQLDQVCIKDNSICVRGFSCVII